MPEPKKEERDTIGEDVVVGQTPVMTTHTRLLDVPPLIADEQHAETEPGAGPARESRSESADSPAATAPEPAGARDNGEGEPDRRQPERAIPAPSEDQTATRVSRPANSLRRPLGERGREQANSVASERTPGPSWSSADESFADEMDPFDRVPERRGDFDLPLAGQAAERTREPLRREVPFRSAGRPNRPRSDEALPPRASRGASAPRSDETRPARRQAVSAEALPDEPRSVAEPPRAAKERRDERPLLPDLDWDALIGGERAERAEGRNDGEALRWPGTPIEIEHRRSGPRPADAPESGPPRAGSGRGVGEHERQQPRERAARPAASAVDRPQPRPRRPAEDAIAYRDEANMPVQGRQRRGPARDDAYATHPPQARPERPPRGRSGVEAELRAERVAPPSDRPSDAVPRRGMDPRARRESSWAEYEGDAPHVAHNPGPSGRGLTAHQPYEDERPYEPALEPSAEDFEGYISWFDLDPVEPTIAPEVPRMCATCRSFRPSESGDRGWCTNEHAFTHRRVVNSDDLPCVTSYACWWLPYDEVWLSAADVQAHSRPTPLVDKWLAQREEGKQRRRS